MRYSKLVYKLLCGKLRRIDLFNAMKTGKTVNGITVNKVK